MMYYDTYAPVVTWFATRLMIVFGILFDWSLQQVDFCHGLSTGTHRNGHVHGDSPRNSPQEWQFQGPHPQIASQSLWSEVNRSRMEFLLGCQTSRDRIQAIIDRQLCLLLQRRHLYRLCGQRHLPWLIQQTIEEYHHRIAKPRP